MRRFFFKSNGESGERIALPEGESRHISRVLRLPCGEKIELLDGKGTVYSAEIIETGRVVYARILGRIGQDLVSGPALIVGQGMLKGKKMDKVVQKCTELGVARFIPFVSSRCQGKLSDLQGEKKHERFKRIVESSCKQCFRPDLMEVSPPLGFEDMVAALPPGRDEGKILFWENEDQVGLHDIVLPDDLRQVSIMLGPEGGFSAEEVACAGNAGWRTVSLGKQILRAETASLTAVSIMQFLLKNI